jgi:hypothetical protein
LPRRQPDREFRPAAGPITARFDGAAVQLDQRAHQREPEAQAASGTFQAGGTLRERLEEPREQPRLDADAVVGNALGYRTPA